MEQGALNFQIFQQRDDLSGVVRRTAATELVNLRIPSAVGCSRPSENPTLQPACLFRPELRAQFFPEPHFP